MSTKMIIIKTRDYGDQAIEAEIVGNLALNLAPIDNDGRKNFHWDKSIYSVTHIATGRSIALFNECYNKQKILEAMEILSPIFDDMPPYETKEYHKWLKKHKATILKFSEMEFEDDDG